MKRLLLILMACQPAFADCVFREDTASQTFLIGPFLDSTDGITAETALTVANTDIRVSKNGANIVAKNSGGGTHDENGMYQITLDATDTDTAGTLQMHIFEAGAVPVFHECLVLATDEYDRITDNANALNNKMVGNPLVTTVATLTDQQNFTLTAAFANNGALQDHELCAEDATQWSCATIETYTAAGSTVLLEEDLKFTLEVGDTVYLRTPAMSYVLNQIWLDTTELGPAVGASISADIANVPTTVWNFSCEDQGGGLTCQEAMSIILAEAAGTAVYTSGSRTWVVSDPSGTETRLTIVYGSELDGDRDTSTPAPMTP